MIVTRVPLRVSLFGGGSDRPDFYRGGAGKVLNFAINRYMFVIGRKQIEPIRKRFLIKWSEINDADNLEGLNHPIFKAALSHFGFSDPLEVITFSDVDSNTGLGSSSAFSVGVSLLLATYQQIRMTKSEIAKTACEIEINIAGRNIGKQDHYGCTYGGVNIFEFNPDDTVLNTPVILSSEAQKEIFSSFRLVYVGGGRDASRILESQTIKSKRSRENIQSSIDLVEPGADALLKSDVSELAYLLAQAWMHKKKFGSSVSNELIDMIYDRGIKAGALGGKLLGAGGGGYILFVVPGDAAKFFDERMSDLIISGLMLDDGGARLTYYDEA